MAAKVIIIRTPGAHKRDLVLQKLHTGNAGDPLQAVTWKNTFSSMVDFRSVAYYGQNLRV